MVYFGLGRGFKPAGIAFFFLEKKRIRVGIQQSPDALISARPSERGYRVRGHGPLDGLLFHVPKRCTKRHARSSQLAWPIILST